MPNEIPEFFFDFDAIKGLSYEDGFKALFFQLQAHYNEHINKKPTFVFGMDPAQPGADRTVVTPPQTPKEDPTAVPISEPNQGGRRKPQSFSADTETITPKTVTMQEVSITKTAEGGAVLTGKADNGAEIEDILLPGYDKAPYGPVVSGRRGRYNFGKEIE